MEAPNIENLFIACVPKFYFDAGNGERQLGLIEKPPSADLKSTEVKIYNSQDGKRRLKKVFSTEEELTLEMVLQEAIAANVQAFFKGGDLTAVGAGTAAVVDQSLTLTGELLASLAKYGLSAVTVRQFLDKCFVYDGAAYTDHSAEADTLAGTPFTTLADAGDFLYLAKITPFSEVYFNFAVEGVYGAVVVQYWNGSAWTAVSNLSGAAAALAADGKMNWDMPIDWAVTTVNGYSGYFLQISATTPWTTPATINCIRQNAVQNIDYILDPGAVTPDLLLGRIGRLSGGFLDDGEQVKVSYTYSTWTSLRFPVATENFVQGAARLAFRPTDGFWWNFVIPRCQLKPNGKVTFDDKAPMELPMMLSVLDASDISPTAPYGYWECLNET